MLARTEVSPGPVRLAARRPYALQACLAALGLTTGAVAVVGTVGAVRIDPVAAHQIRVAGQALSYPAMNLASVLVLIIALVGAVSLVRMIRAWWRIMREHRRFATHLEAAGTGVRMVEVDGAPVALHGFACDRPEAFCAGFLRPRIYISTQALDVLDDRELAAVAAHERQHQRARDPLRGLMARLLARGLFFLPVLGRLLRTGELLAEIDADGVALRALDFDGAPLASAMLSMSSASGDTVVGIGPERVDHLLGRPVRAPLPLGLIGLGLVTLMVMIAVLWRALQAATISATFSLPLVSRQPCILVLATVPIVLGLSATAWQSARLALSRR